MLKHANILVAGSGFIGTNLTNRLAAMDARVTATWHRQRPRWPVPGVDYVRCDLTRLDDCERVVQGMDYVFMCAARTSGAALLEADHISMLTPNVMMNTALLDACYRGGVKKYLFVSSSTVYPVVSHPVLEDEVNHQFFNKYKVDGWVKRFSEVVCEMYADSVKHPLKTVILRPANLYGPHDNFDPQHSHVIPALIRKVVERQDPIEVWGDGRDLKGFVYIDDFIEAMVLAMTHMDQSEPVNIAEIRPYTIREVLDVILRADGYQDARIAFNQSRPTMIKKRLMDSTKARMQLDFTSKTSLEAGIAKTITWYRAQRAAGDVE
jgi:GDP-L-fucose synthase